MRASRAAIGRLTWVDLFFLAALPCLFAGVALLTRSRPGRFPVAGWFDALAAGLAITALALALSAPAILDYGPQSTVDQITNTVYPFVDLLMLGFLAGSLLTHGARGSRAMQLVAAGLVVWTATDAAFAIRLAEGTYRGGILDVLWPVGAVLIAAGAVRGFDPRAGGPRAPIARPRASRSRAASSPSASSASPGSRTSRRSPSSPLPPPCSRSCCGCWSPLANTTSSSAPRPTTP